MGVYDTAIMQQTPIRFSESAASIRWGICCPKQGGLAFKTTVFCLINLYFYGNEMLNLLKAYCFPNIL